MSNEQSSQQIDDMMSSSITVQSQNNDWFGNIMYWWSDWICADYRAWQFHNVS